MTELKTGIVVAPQPAAVEVGARVLQRGGNAFDAAIATAFAQMVVDPQKCGLGGFGCLTLYRADHDQALVIDFNATAGARAREDQWVDSIIDEKATGYGWTLKGQVNEIGYGAIATPGTVAGLAELYRHHASLHWADLIAPAITLAVEGFRVTPELARDWAMPVRPPMLGPLTRLAFNQESSRIYLKGNNDTYLTGERFRNPDYGMTLRSLAEHGPEEFYTGELSRRMARDLEANGATVTLADLESYRPRVLEPLSGSYLGRDILTNPAPGGGPTVLEMLNVLEGYDLPSLGHSSEDFVYVMARAQAAAMIDRVNLVGDPAFIDVPAGMLTSKERACEWRERLDRGERVVVPRFHPDAPSTTNVTVVDRQGNCIALTHTLGSASGVISPGLGFMYNNAMNCFDPRPGTVNGIVPGKGRITGIAPTIGLKAGRPVIVLGAPGGTRIMTGILQVLVNALAFGMSAVEAVSAPRVDCQSDNLDAEARIPSWVVEAAAERAGLRAIPNPAPYGRFSIVQLALIDPETGVVTGAGDPRKGGAAMTG